MANILTNALDNIGDWQGAKIAPHINDTLGVRYNVLSSYYEGDYRPQLKVREGQPNDNIIQNFLGLAEMPKGYPRPIVDHAERRERAIGRFTRARKVSVRP